jgi:peptidoglycan hydrolase-like protein with peptidoglycan-binding domain
MKKIIVFLTLLLMPGFALASIDQNLYYGLTQNDKVRELQQFLIEKGFLSLKATGNFYSMTLSAVKNYQSSKNIRTTGYVGPLTRAAINADLSIKPADSSESLPAAATETTTTPLSGSLDLSKNASYNIQSISAPQSKFKLADFTLTNGTSEPINISSIDAYINVNSNKYIASLYVSNLYIAYANTKTSLTTGIAYKNSWTINYQLLSGQAINLSVYGDVNSSIPLNSTVDASIAVAGTTANSKTSVNANSEITNITFGTSSLTAAIDSTSPTSKITTANQKVIAGKFKFTATNNSYIISELKFIFPASPSIITGATLSDTDTQAVLMPKPISATYNGADYIFDFNDLNISIPLNSSKSLTLYYNLSPAIYTENTNKNAAPILAYIKAENSEGTLTEEAVRISANNLYVFKSTPVFSADSSSITASNNSDADIYKFSITADPNGDIAIKQLMFNIAVSDANNSYPFLNNFKFFKGDKDYSALVNMGIKINNINSTLINSGISIGTSTIILTFDTEETIPAGTTQTYILKARLNNFGISFYSDAASTDSVSVYIPSDSAQSTSGSYLRMIFTNIYGLASTPTDSSVGTYNVLWSDKSAVMPSHSYTNGASTKDWYNGFEVLTLSLPTQTITSR